MGDSWWNGGTGAARVPVSAASPVHPEPRPSRPPLTSLTPLTSRKPPMPPVSPVPLTVPMVPVSLPLPVIPVIPPPVRVRAPFPKTRSPPIGERDRAQRRLELRQTRSGRRFLLQQGGQNLPSSPAVDGSSGSSYRTACNVARVVERENGERPPRAAQSVAPSDQTSDGGPWGVRRHARVPCSPGSRPASRPW